MILSLLALMISCASSAQLVRKKSLITYLGGGGSILGINGPVDALTAHGITGGAIDFAFAYAFNPYWSMGIHFQRQGSQEVNVDVDQVRVARYDLEGSVRLVNREKGALEMTAAVGLSQIGLRDRDQRLPVEAIDFSGTIGARYLRMITNTLGAYASINWSPKNDGVLWQGEEPVNDVAGKQLTLEWANGAIAAGLMVRF